MSGRRKRVNIPARKGLIVFIGIGVVIAVLVVIVSGGWRLPFTEKTRVVQLAPDRFDSTGSKSPEQVVTEMRARLRIAQQEMTAYRVDTFLRSRETVSSGVSLFYTWTAILQDASSMTLPADLSRELDQFKTALVGLQRETMPRLRDTYFREVRREFARSHVVVSTTGADEKTIRFTGAPFAAEANAEAFQKELEYTFNLFRFGRSEYAWKTGNSPIRTYTLPGYADSTLVWVDATGQFHPFR